jgi:hypothetical protein
MATSGGELVVLTGVNFSDLPTTNVTASYVNSVGMTFGPTSLCTLQTAGTQIRCTTLHGIGTSLRWRVTFDGVDGPLSAALNSYRAPAISSIVRWRGLVCVCTVGLMRLC